MAKIIYKFDMASTMDTLAPGDELTICVAGEGKLTSKHSLYQAATKRGYGVSLRMSDDGTRVTMTRLH